MSQESDRDALAAEYLELLPYPPYPVQEEALLNWFTSDQGVMVCAPTGTGKTLIAEAAMFEALATGQRAYYTTPLIALTDQKFHELQAAAVRWGFREDDVGLVTGNRRINPDASLLVVVAEILFNRLLHGETFHFDDVCAVVMDEFHSFNDLERGIVWELTLGLLPPHVKLLLLSATVGNSVEFVNWLRRCHNRNLELVQSDQRKVPLTFAWIGDDLLNEFVEQMAQGDEATRKTPALIFCFNRDECWDVAEQLKGKQLMADGQKARLAAALERYDWSLGVGPKLKQMLMRGVGVHHAGVMPRYRRVVEELFQEKLLSVTVCTETLAAGINLPARSVVLPNLLKGPPDNKKLIDPSSAHQMFGRAGRPQFDSQGFVYVLAHEDDVKYQRWKKQYDQIPEDTKDPALRQAKKNLKRKMPHRSANEQYWTESQFEKLRTAAPLRLTSRGHLPWRLLAYMLDATPDVERLRTLVGKRLMEPKRIEAGQRALDQMLMTLWTAGYVTLEPEPPKKGEEDEASRTNVPARPDLVGPGDSTNEPPPPPPPYRPRLAHPTPELAKLLMFRGVNPLYGVFLIKQLGIADRAERLQAVESILELPKSFAHFVRVPPPEELPPGPLATTRLDVQLLHLGLATAEELGAGSAEEEEDDRDRRRSFYQEERPRILTLADKLRMLFDYDFPNVPDLYTSPVWAAGELLAYGGDFNKFVTSKGLQKQEGILFRHLLRLILMLGEFQQLTPAETTEDEWRSDLRDMADRLTQSCRQVDPASTDRMLEQAEEGNGT